MPNTTCRAVALAALAAAIIAAVVALDLSSAAAQSDDEQSGRIVARRLDDGRTEFGWQPVGGEWVLPANRYFPANVGHQRWLNSGPVEVGGAEIGRINARLADDGRIEFAFTPTDRERILTDARYFPVAPRADRWLRSTKITIGPPPPPFIAVSAGDRHSCGLRESGEIVCWGFETPDDGQLDAPEGSFLAVTVPNHIGWHTCAIAETFETVAASAVASGEIECWGLNDYGQSNAPTDSDFIAVSAGDRHTCGLRERGAIVCWGLNDRGQTDVPAGRFSSVSAGVGYACGLRESGVIACWGVNISGQSSPPAGRFAAVSAGDTHACGLRESGEIVCWGRSGHGELNAPAGSFSVVSAGAAYTCGLRTGGAIECWGRNDHGQTDAAAGPFTAISAGSFHACGLRESGEIACWGLNDEGLVNAPTP